MGAVAIALGVGLLALMFGGSARASTVAPAPTRRRRPDNAIAGRCPDGTTHPIAPGTSVFVSVDSADGDYMLPGVIQAGPTTIETPTGTALRYSIYVDLVWDGAKVRKLWAVHVPPFRLCPRETPTTPPPPPPLKRPTPAPTPTPTPTPGHHGHLPAELRIASPVAGVSDAQWLGLLRRMATQPMATVSSAGRLGTFLMDPRQLADLGLMSGVKRNDSGEWVGTWKDGHSKGLFLRNPARQVGAFSQWLARNARAIAARHADQLGATHATKRATLSGLLGVAHAAGLGGLRGWLGSEGDKARFPNTTAAYLRTVGIF